MLQHQNIYGCEEAMPRVAGYAESDAWAASVIVLIPCATPLSRMVTKPSLSRAR